MEGWRSVGPLLERKEGSVRGLQHASKSQLGLGSPTICS